MSEKETEGLATYEELQLNHYRPMIEESQKYILKNFKENLDFFYETSQPANLIHYYTMSTIDNIIKTLRNKLPKEVRDIIMESIYNKLKILGEMQDD